MSDRWYCARIKPRQDGIATEHLNRQGFEVYNPKISIERLGKNGRITWDREPLFPGYLLIAFAFHDHHWRAINSTRGVVKLLCFGDADRPSAMPQGEVENIKAREKSGLLYISEVKRIRRGDQVKVKIGHAADQIGKVLFTRGERVEFLLDLLGRKTRVKAPLHVVEVIRPTY